MSYRTHAIASVFKRQVNMGSEPLNKNFAVKVSKREALKKVALK